MPAKRLRVTGRVQGVFFRAHTKEMADALGITGWVRNEPDGSVLIHAEGKAAALARLLTWCHDGPSGTQVTSVEIEHATEEGYETFCIIH